MRWALEVTTWQVYPFFATVRVAVVASNKQSGCDTALLRVSKMLENLSNCILIARFVDYRPFDDEGDV